MPNKEEADKAIAGLNGKELKGRNLTINEARPRTDDRKRSGGFGGGRGRQRTRRRIRRRPPVLIRQLTS
jgi:RNA recognition motif-containing protein